MYRLLNTSSVSIITKENITQVLLAYRKMINTHSPFQALGLSFYHPLKDFFLNNKELELVYPES